MVESLVFRRACARPSFPGGIERTYRVVAGCTVRLCPPGGRSEPSSRRLCRRCSPSGLLASVHIVADLQTQSDALLALTDNAIEQSASQPSGLNRTYGVRWPRQAGIGKACQWWIPKWRSQASVRSSPIC